MPILLLVGKPNLVVMATPLAVQVALETLQVTKLGQMAVLEFLAVVVAALIQPQQQAQAALER
jgi:hypothetical protein